MTDPRDPHRRPEPHPWAFDPRPVPAPRWPTLAVIALAVWALVVLVVVIAVVLIVADRVVM